MVTGAAGFIGSKVLYELARRGDFVVGIDNINDYYDVRLKYGRLVECGFDNPESIEFNKVVRNSRFENCLFIRMSIDDKEMMDRIFEEYRFDKVMNLAAQAGVRYSITNPYSYLQSNMAGLFHCLRTLGTSGYVALVVCWCYIERRADKGVQQWRHDA